MKEEQKTPLLRDCERNGPRAGDRGGVMLLIKTYVGIRVVLASFQHGSSSLVVLVVVVFFFFFFSALIWRGGVLWASLYTQ